MLSPGMNLDVDDSFFEHAYFLGILILSDSRPFSILPCMFLYVIVQYSLKKGNPMTIKGCIELRDINIATQIGTYAPDESVPDQNLLDLTLWLHTELILIAADDMKNVFDYDPLLQEIDRLAGDGHYETQEWLIKRIVTACANYPEIKALEIALRKSPVREDGGSLGLRLRMSEEAMSSLRATTR
jgi:dihydroneopterin aldolase